MEAVAEPRGRARALHALRSRDFRLLWAGQTISLVGDGAFLVALGWNFGLGVWNPLMQFVPESKSARVSSLDFFGSFALVPVGYALRVREAA